MAPALSDADIARGHEDHRKRLGGRAFNRHVPSDKSTLPPTAIDCETGT